MRALLVAVFLVMAVAVQAAAASGDIDPSFGGDGVVHTDFSSDVSLLDTALGVALQPDGKILLAGRAGGGGGRFALARYLTDGTLDPTFGGDGKVLTNLSAGADAAFDVAIQSDDSIVVAGRAGGNGGQIAVVRYLSDGARDPSFDGDGKLLIDVTPRADAARSLVIQPDGNIVVAGYAGSTWAVLRLTTDGLLDDGFGGDGLVRPSFTGERDAAAAVALDSSGRVVVAGTAGMDPNGFGNSDLAVARYLDDGTLDDTFEGDGKWLREISSGGDVAYGVAIQSDQKILVVGTTGIGIVSDPDWDAVILRLDELGVLDPTFSDDGIRGYNVTNRPDVATGVAIQSDGMIVQVGTSIRSCCSRAWLVRYKANGNIDQTFGNGRVLTDPADASSGQDVALLPDGRIVIAGRAGSSDSVFSVMRFLP
jgi:uncharacterized delta-60 repeat protein